MECLDVVDDDDSVIGCADIDEIHRRGLRHRSVQIMVFRTYDLEELLVARRAKQDTRGSLKLQQSAGGHVASGSNYLESAYSEIAQELFHGIQVPNLFLTDVARYRNDTRQLNKENTVLYYAACSGPFSFDESETDALFWSRPQILWLDMQANPRKYTETFVNALREFRTKVKR